MSAVPGTPPYLFAQQGTFPGPFTFTVPASLEVQVASATATYDGTMAGAAFLRCMTIYSQSGEILARVFPQGVTATGQTDLVSFAPFPGGVGNSGPGGSGIQFNTSPQTGTYLETTTTGAGPSGYGTNIEDTGSGIQVASTDRVNVHIPGEESQLLLTTTDVNLQAERDVTVQTNGGAVNLDATTIVQASVNGHNTVEAKLLTGNHPGLGFFAASPVVQQAAPSSAQDIADALAAYGLLAAAGTVPAGLAYGTNTGPMLEVDTTAVGGITLHDTYGAVPTYGITLQSDNGSVGLFAADEIQLQAPGRGIGVGFDAATLIGFYGATPVAQPATPVTLADVIALLQSLGLSA